MNIRGICAYFGMFAIAAMTVFAQSQDARGNIVGRVLDPSGAVIPATEVKGVSDTTGVVISTKTNAAGNYVLPFLIPGMYTVTAEIQGFRKFERKNVQIRVNENVSLDIQMTVGEVTESVQVTAESPLLQTSEASLGQVVDERRITELPLFAGNAMDLVHLAPGTVNGTDMRLRKAAFNNAPVTILHRWQRQLRELVHHRRRGEHLFRRHQPARCVLASAGVAFRVQGADILV